MLKATVGEGSAIKARLSVEAFTMVLLDMGNGVTRIESFEFLQSLACPCLLTAMGFVPVLFPLSDRVHDAVLIVVSSLRSRGPPCEGCCRPVGDLGTEFVLW
jgi:hypothetical protein